ncbi:hypothetical protein HHX38_16120 [Streptomyces sp. PKU-MA01144]|uniref:hypothetical protein n=1 Tax=Streptomyces sp. PKU-MA01144 TaxID=2729138 RepID=UPI00147C561C|nr:hypothetical protein [Streptomyces sp. PKU-MA01144]NNJ05652.1 hypothetical protein [Streptomyces sp. PKU-MA01144]
MQDHLMPTEPGPFLDRALLDTAPATGASLARQAATQLDRVMSVGPFRGEDKPIPLRPVFLPRQQYEALPRVARRLRRLMAAACHRRATTPGALAQALEWQRPGPSLWTEDMSQNRWALEMARPDFVLRDGVPQLMEFNVNSAMGGTEQLPRMDRVYWSRPDIRGAAARWPMWSHDAWEERRRLILRAGRAMGRPRPAVAMLGWEEEAGYGSEAAFADVIADLRSNGIPTFYVRPGELRVRGDHAYAGTNRIDIVLRTFVTADADQGDIDLGPLREIVRRNAALVLSPEACQLYSSKRAIAWLTEDAASGVLTSADQRFVQRHVPSTHVLRRDGGRLVSASGDDLSRVLREQENWILKPFQGHSADGIVTGRSCNEAEWNAVIEEAASRGTYIAQQFIESDTMEMPLYNPVDGTSSMVKSRCVLSPLLFGDACGGILARHSGTDKGEIVNTGTGTMNSTFGWE